MFREFARIQNSMFGLVILSQNIYSGELAIQYYKAINPKKPSEIKKGDKIYDYQNGGFFSLNIFEAKELALYLNMVFRKPDFDMPEYEITHFPKDGVHKLVIKPIKEKKGIEFSIVYIQNKKVVKSVKLFMNRITVEVLIDFLTTYKDVITLKNMLQEIRFKPKNNQTNNEDRPTRNGSNRNEPINEPTNEPDDVPSDFGDDYSDIF